MLRLPKFKYMHPKNIKEAVCMRADSGPESIFVAGGTDLYPNMKRRQQTPKVVIGLAHLAPLRKLRGKPEDGMTLGASLTLTEIAGNRKLRRAYPAVVRAAELVSTPLLRNMGTIGGNLLLDTRCNYYDQNYEWRKSINFCMKKEGTICWVAPSSPRCWAVQSSDSVPLMVAIGASVTLVSHEGERVIPAAELYHDDGIQYLNKRPEELLTEVRLPATNGWRATYWKLRRRDSFDFPVLGVATWLRTSPDETIEDIRIVLGGVGSHPIRATATEDQLRGQKLTAEIIEQAAAASYPVAKPLDNTDFAMSWRKDMARYYVAGTLRELAGLAVTPPRPPMNTDSALRIFAR